MNKTLQATIAISAAVLLASPTWAKCGDDGILKTLEDMVRRTYFKGDDLFFRDWRDNPKKLSFEQVRVVGLDRDLGIHRCAAAVRFEASGFEAAYFAGLSEAGPQSVPVQYEVSPDARDPGANIVTLRRIPALRKNPDL